MIRKERLAGVVDGDFIVFLIGMRINRRLAVHKWLPVVRAMPRMITELHRRPDLGFMHAEMWLARTTIMVQYWRSMDQLLGYAKDKSAEHLQAWRAFNKSVGIWHETYSVSPGSFENIYVNMPEFGLGKAGRLEPVSGAKNGAAGRLNIKK